MESLKDSAKTDAMAYLQTTLEEAKLTAQQEARKIVINTIQRIGTEEEAVENCVSVFNQSLMMLRVELLVEKEETLEQLKRLLA